MGIYANSDFGQAKPTEMTVRRSVTEGSVPADFGKNHYGAFALGSLRQPRTLLSTRRAVISGARAPNSPRSLNISRSTGEPVTIQTSPIGTHVRPYRRRQPSIVTTAT